ncbi:MAG: FMN-binding protein [Bacteroidales bacterium]|nr:FMN-binding protein [Bacteroidales bacterium]
MKKILIILAMTVCLGAVANAQTKEKDPSKTIQGNGTIVINTTTLCNNVEGFMGPTPVEIRIRKDTIADITPLANDETPGYFYEAAKLLKKWIGLTPAKGLDLEVDAVSGATFSSNALIENVRAGLARAMRKEE